MKKNKDQSGKETGNTGFPQSQSHIIVELTEYIPDSIVSKTVVKKTGGDVTASSFDEGEKLCEKSIEYDTYVQIIDGKAEVTISNKDYKLNLGEGMIIPAHALHCFKADEQFKMLTTIIKDYKED
jgi:quercetin dioxygenase-like cupin family protein